MSGVSVVIGIAPLIVGIAAIIFGFLAKPSRLDRWIFWIGGTLISLAGIMHAINWFQLYDVIRFLAGNPVTHVIFPPIYYYFVSPFISAVIGLIIGLIFVWRAFKTPLQRPFKITYVVMALVSMFRFLIMVPLGVVLIIFALN